MKKLLFLFFAILISREFCLAQESLSEIARRVKPSVVTIIANGNNKTTSEVGSGFFAAPIPRRNKLPLETIASFAKRIREKADAYYDKKDLDIVGRVLNKYPEYRTSVNFHYPLEDIAPKIVVKDPYPISGSFVVTNWHVVKDAKSILIKTNDKKVFDITEIVAYSVAGDIAILRIADPKCKYISLELSESYPEQGDSVIVIGTPLGLLEGSMSNGIVSANRDLPPFGEVMQITAPLSPGNSGSPVLDAEGKVIGVATFDLSKGQNLNFAISKRLLERVLYPGDPMGLYR